MSFSDLAPILINYCANLSVAVFNRSLSYLISFCLNDFTSVQRVISMHIRRFTKILCVLSRQLGGFDI